MISTKELLEYLGDPIVQNDLVYTYEGQIAPCQHYLCIDKIFGLKIKTYTVGINYSLELVKKKVVIELPLNDGVDVWALEDYISSDRFTQLLSTLDEEWTVVNGEGKFTQKAEEVIKAIKEDLWLLPGPYHYIAPLDIYKDVFADTFTSVKDGSITADEAVNLIFGDNHRFAKMSDDGKIVRHFFKTDFRKALDKLSASAVV